MANSVDPDEMPHSAASHLGLNCLLRPVSPNTYGIHSGERIFAVGHLFLEKQEIFISKLTVYQETWVFMHLLLIINPDRVHV